MSEKVDRGLRWPRGIILGTIGIILLSAGTIWIAVKNPVQMSNDFINKYKVIDKNINDVINANIAFNKKYSFSYIPNPLRQKECEISYKVVTKEGKAVNDATIHALLTRPDEVNHDIKLELKRMDNGLYTFKKVDLPLEGRWNLFANVTVGDEKGFLRLKLDTRYPKDILDFETVLPMN